MIDYAVPIKASDPGTVETVSGWQVLKQILQSVNIDAIYIVCHILKRSFSFNSPLAICN